MPDFVLFKSEFALRTENRQQAQTIERQRREIARLRALVGEPVETIAEVRAAAPAIGESFTSGACTISMRPAGAPGPKLSPAAATAGSGTPRREVAEVVPTATLKIADAASAAIALRPSLAPTPRYARTIVDGTDGCVVNIATPKKDGAPQAQPVTVGQTGADSEDAAVLRFSMLEMDELAVTRQG